MAARARATRRVDRVHLYAYLYMYVCMNVMCVLRCLCACSSRPAATPRVAGLPDTIGAGERALGHACAAAAVVVVAWVITVGASGCARVRWAAPCSSREHHVCTPPLVVHRQQCKYGVGHAGVVAVSTSRRAAVSDARRALCPGRRGSRSRSIQYYAPCIAPC